MADWYRYGEVKPFFFKVTLASVGINGLVFQSSDIKYSKDGATGVNCDAHGTIAETALGLGWYKWTPDSAIRTQNADVIIINIKDDVGSEFDENGFQYYLGGDANTGRFTGD